MRTSPGVQALLGQRPRGRPKSPVGALLSRSLQALEAVEPLVGVAPRPTPGVTRAHLIQDGGVGLAQHLLPVGVLGKEGDDPRPAPVAGAGSDAVSLLA